MRARILFAVLFCGFLLAPSPALAQTEVIEYYATDTLGTVRVVFDATGAIKSRRDYEPFGAPVSTITSDPKIWAGLFRDDESGLEYAQARMYQAKTGRFLSVDPVYAGLFNPQGWNRYAYALQNPLTFIDRLGLDPEDTRVVPCSEEQEKRGGGCIATELDVKPEKPATAYADRISDWWESASEAALNRFAQWLSPSGEVQQPRVTCGGTRLGCVENVEVKMAGVPSSAAVAAAVIAVANAAKSPQVQQAAQRLETAARSQYVKLADKYQWHHIVPKYLGGDPNGALVRLNAAYHQLITNAFRELWPYGSGRTPSPGELASMVQRVYTNYPLPPSGGR